MNGHLHKNTLYILLIQNYNYDSFKQEFIVFKSSHAMKEEHMSLQLILGSSGCGKSHKLYNEIIDKSIKNEDVNYLIIVPEQFTLQTQKEIVETHPHNGTMNVDVLSFGRLAYRVFDEVGANNQPVLEDTGKSMILRKVLSLKNDKLIFFGKEASKIGFVSELKSLISEMFQYSVTGEDLKGIKDNVKDRPMLSNKLHDISIIYNGFKEYLEEKYITQEEVLDVLCNVIEKSELIKNSVISFDGFTGFTPAQYKLIGLLMKLSKKVIVTITVDKREDISRVGEEFELFHLSKKTIHRLYKISKENNISIDKPIYPAAKDNNEIYRFKGHKALASLEKNLFRYPYNVYEDSQDDIKIHISKNPKQEVSFVVRETMRLVREEKYRYQDIAIITGDISKYANILEGEFQRANIPCFIDNKRELLNNPYVEMLRAMLDIINNDFDYESIFRFLRSGLLDYSYDELDILENYIIAFGIRGKSFWAKEWTKEYKGQQEGQLKQINKIRGDLIENLSSLAEVLLDKEKTVKEYTIAIYDQIIKINVAEKLDVFRKQLEEEGMYSVAKEYQQIYGIVVDLFDKMVELLGEEHLSLKEYIEILEAGLGEAKVGIIPPGLDQVVVGDIERTRLNHVKAVFFIGVNDGIIPKNIGEGGILSDLDRDLLSKEELELAPTRRQVAYMEQFYLYLVMTKPRERLYLSYSKLDEEGKTIRPSYLISIILKLFPSIKINNEEAKNQDVEHILGSDKGIDYLIQGIKKYPDANVSNYWRELYSYYYQDEKGQGILKNIIKGAFYKNHQLGLTEDVAKELYGTSILGSVTRFEQFGACPFSHFAKYGLNLQERVEYSLQVFDIGNLFHDALENFSKKLHNSKYDWSNIPEDLQEEWAEESVTLAAEDTNNAIFSSSKRYEYIVSRAKRITTRTIWALRQQINKGDFTPYGYEVYFSDDEGLESLDILISDESRVKLRGRIDRIDVCEENDKLLVRVIDYKSGRTKFDLLRIYHGLQLQLAIYLNAAIEYLKKINPDKEIIPAGILYYHIDDPIVNKGSDVEDSILKELKMDGIINNDNKVIKRLDSSFNSGETTIKPGVKSDIIPVSTNKDGSLSKNSKVVKIDELKALEQYVTHVVKEYGGEILSGNLEVSPYKYKDKIACKYCPYDGVCGFDCKIEGYNFRNLTEIKDNEIWDKIYESMEESLEENNVEGGE